MNQEHMNWDALVKYITGQNSFEEEEVIREWMQLDPKHEEFIIFLKKIWDSSAEKKHSWDVDSAWSRFNEQYDSLFFEDRPPAVQKTNVLRSNRMAKQSWMGWVAVAASIALIFTALFSLDMFHPERAVEEQELVVHEITTKNGQRTQLNLSDGSRVYLNAGSKLSVPETFKSEGPRELVLSGEAWFEVAHDPERPFIVFTEDVMTRVLGTKFQVRSYPEDEQVEVVVSEGKVELQKLDTSNTTGKIITKNQIGVLFNDGLTTVSSVSDLSPYSGWTNGKLVFLQDPLQKVILRLERWYNIDIRVDPALFELNQKQLTASFTEKQSVHEVLEAIALALDLAYKKDEGSSAFIFYTNNQ